MSFDAHRTVTRARSSRRIINNRIYLTNVQVSRKELYKEAILKSGRTDIHIDDNPIPEEIMDTVYEHYRKAMLGNYFSLYKDEDSPFSDCSDFWKVLEELEREPRWETYFKLLQD